MPSLKSLIPNRYNNPSMIISVIIIAVTVGNFIDALQHLNFTGYGPTEFFINFQGGYVRRGLLGELLYRFVGLTGIPPLSCILVFCTLFYVATLAFFVVAFRRRGYCWWLIFSPFLLGMNNCFIRKDFVLALNFVAIVALLAQADGSLWRKAVATGIALWSLMLHEAFIFYGGIFTILLLISASRNKAGNWVMAATIVLLFLINSAFKGSEAHVAAIYHSWETLLGSAMERPFNGNSIEALGWQLIPTLRTHLVCNFYVDNSPAGLLFQPLAVCAGYYLLTNFLAIYRGPQAVYGQEQRRSLSTLLIMAFIFLLPMILGLSCDYGRLFQYGGATAFTVFLLVSPERVKSFTPKIISRAADGVNAFIDRWMRPNKVTILLVLLLAAPMSMFSFDPAIIFRYSIYGSLSHLGYLLMAIL